MAFHFYCQCGRKLIVADDQEGRNATCPVCGIVVKAPQRRDPGPSGDSVLSLDFLDRPGRASPPLERVSLRSYARQMRRCWRAFPTPFDMPLRDSLWLPFTELWLIVRLSLFLTIGLLIVRALMLSELERANSILPGPTLGFAILFGVTGFAFLAQFLRHVVTEGAAAGGEIRLWTGFTVRGATQAAVRGMVVLLAGPSLVLAFGVWYWIRCGTLGLLDRFVLFEAAALGCGWLAFAALCTRRGQPLRAAAPASIARAVALFGWESLGFAIWAGGIFWGTVWFFQRALDLAHEREGLAAFFVFWFGFAFAVGTSAALLHRLGVRYAQLTFVPSAEQAADAAKPAAV